MHNLCTIITTNIHGCILSKKPSKTFKQNPRKYLKKSFLVQLQALQMNSFTRIFQSFAKSLENFVNDFWEDCFRKRKPLLTANSPIYLNTVYQ